MKDLQWKNKKYAESDLLVPEATGVYVITRVEYNAGLPITVTPIYVGQSKNLKRRLSQHLPWNETNPDLASFLLRHMKEIEIWYATVKKSDLDRVERTLIKKLDPDRKFNKLRYKSTITRRS